MRPIEKYGWEEELPSEINEMNKNNGGGLLWNPELNNEKDKLYKGFFKNNDCMMIIYNDGFVSFVGCDCSDFSFEELQAIYETSKQIREGK